jgi:hypothetical protein
MRCVLVCLTSQTTVGWLVANVTTIMNGAIRSVAPEASMSCTMLLRHAPASGRAAGCGLRTAGTKLTGTTSRSRRASNARRLLHLCIELSGTIERLPSAKAIGMHAVFARDRKKRRALT